ncbi:hypothetical protein VTO42DRAFT_3032 [Malbranchea cinnamomea]
MLHLSGPLCLCGREVVSFDRKAPAEFCITLYIALSPCEQKGDDISPDVGCGIKTLKVAGFHLYPFIPPQSQPTGGILLIRLFSVLSTKVFVEEASLPCRWFLCLTGSTQDRETPMLIVQVSTAGTISTADTQKQRQQNEAEDGPPGMQGGLRPYCKTCWPQTHGRHIEICELTAVQWHDAEELILNINRPTTSSSWPCGVRGHRTQTSQGAERRSPWLLPQASTSELRSRKRQGTTREATEDHRARQPPWGRESIMRLMMD